jgi:hypothetical protein
MHMHKSSYYYISAAAATGIAGILHFVLGVAAIGMAPIFGILFFVVAGLAQLFWVLPMIKRWGRIWYYIGISGTILLIILWAIVRLPDITSGTRFPLNWEDVSIVFLEIIYIGITVLIIAKERTVHAAQREELR